MTTVSSGALQRLSALVYGLSLFVLFTVSTAFHALAYSGRFRSVRHSSKLTPQSANIQTDKRTDGRTDYGRHARSNSAVALRSWSVTSARASVDWDWPPIHTARHDTTRLESSRVVSCRRLSSFDTMKAWIFGALGWKMPIHASKIVFIWRGGGYLPLNEVQYQRNPQKANSCVSPHHLSYQAWKSSELSDMYVSFSKGGINKIFVLFTNLPRSLHGWISSNHLCQIIWRSV